MLKYARFQLDGKDSSGNTLLSKEALAFAHAPAVDAPTGEFTGLTWFVRKYGEITSAFHGGTYIGYRAFLQLIPDHDFAVIVLTNSDRGVEAYTAVADAMVSAFTKLEHHTAVAKGVDPSVLDPFVGVFKGSVPGLGDHEKWRQVSICTEFQTDQAGCESCTSQFGQHSRRVVYRHGRAEQRRAR